ncbi:MAG: anti-anti-sigma factor [Rhodobacterales bacterium]|nr:MAG: anti-anti-sigma factor [Rhodobacterales bacterium]
MELSFEDIGDLRVIKAQEDRIDATVAIQFKDRMRELTDDAPPRLLLDLSRVGFLDSSGLGALVAAYKQAAPGRRLELAGLSPTVEKVFKLTRMDSVFTIHASAGDVAAQFAEAG